jgi:hypothetical protein
MERSDDADGEGDDGRDEEARVRDAGQQPGAGAHVPVVNFVTCAPNQGPML